MWNLWRGLRTTNGNLRKEEHWQSDNPSMTKAAKRWHSRHFNFGMSCISWSHSEKSVPSHQIFFSLSSRLFNAQAGQSKIIFSALRSFNYIFVSMVQVTCGKENTSQLKWNGSFIYNFTAWPRGKNHGPSSVLQRIVLFLWFSRLAILVSAKVVANCRTVMKWCWHPIRCSRLDYTSNLSTKQDIQAICWHTAKECSEGVSEPERTLFF